MIFSLHVRLIYIWKMDRLVWPNRWMTIWPINHRGISSMTISKLCAIRVDARLANPNVKWSGVWKLRKLMIIVTNGTMWKPKELVVLVVKIVPQSKFDICFWKIWRLLLLGLDRLYPYSIWIWNNQSKFGIYNNSLLIRIQILVNEDWLWWLGYSGGI